MLVTLVCEVVHEKAGRYVEKSLQQWVGTSCLPTQRMLEQGSRCQSNAL